jgi:hypothetical protein
MFAFIHEAESSSTEYRPHAPVDYREYTNSNPVLTANFVMNSVISISST